MIRELIRESERIDNRDSGYNRVLVEWITNNGVIINWCVNVRNQKIFALYLDDMHINGFRTVEVQNSVSLLLGYLLSSSLRHFR